MAGGMTTARAREMTTYFADPDEYRPPDEPLPLVAFLAEHRHLVYRVAVVGDSVAEVVQQIGGWIFDQSALGWHVTVITVDIAGAGALRIFGAQSVSLAEAEANGGEYPQPHVLMASTSLCRANPSVRAAVGAIIRGKKTQVLLFGEDVTAGQNQTVRRIEHPLSSATAAFKSHATCSFGDASVAASVEVFGHAGRCGVPHVPGVREVAWYPGRRRDAVNASSRRR